MSYQPDMETLDQRTRIFDSSMRKKMAFKLSFARLQFSTVLKNPPTAYDWINSFRSRKALKEGGPVTGIEAQKEDEERKKMEIAIPDRTKKAEEPIKEHPYNLSVKMVKVTKPINKLYYRLLGTENVKNVLITIRGAIYRTSFESDLVALQYARFTDFIDRTQRDVRDMDPLDKVLNIRISTLSHELVIASSKNWMILVEQETRYSFEAPPQKVNISDSGRLLSIENPVSERTKRVRPEEI